MRKILLPAFILSTTTLIGCASRSEIETMKRQLEYLERSSGQTQERLMALDSLFRLTVEKNVGYQADLRAALGDMLDKMSIIDGRLTDMERRINTLAERSGVRLPTYTPPESGTPMPVDTGTSSALPHVDANKMFDDAFTDLRSGRYDLAIMQFQEYLSLFPNTPLTDDAQYWLAECYYGKRDFARAIPEFELVERKYPQSDKLTPSLFKLARSYEQTGNTTRAVQIYERIVRDFPDSFERQQAEDKLKELR